MEPLQPNSAVLPPALRALTLSLLIETVLPLLERPAGGHPELQGPDTGKPEGEGELCQLLQRKCAELSALVLRLPILGWFESGPQGQANGAGATTESWDSPFEPRRSCGYLPEGHRGTPERSLRHWGKPTSPNSAPAPPSGLHPGP
jgi:hypothetical protein